MTDDGQIKPPPGEEIADVFTRRFAAAVEWYQQRNGKLSSVALSRWLTDQGYDASPSYISRLRKGVVRTPSFKVLEGIAKFFELDPAYFMASNDANAAAMMEAVTDSEVRRLALRAGELSTENLDALTRIIIRIKADDEEEEGS